MSPTEGIDPLMALALLLLVNIGAGLVRVLRGPTRADRMLAAQLFGTTGVATALVLARALDADAVMDVALVLALLAAVAAAAFARTARRRRQREATAT